MNNLEDQARDIISQYTSQVGVDKKKLDSFCSDITSLSDYLSKDLISFDTYKDICNIILHKIPGTIIINDMISIRYISENGYVKAEIVRAEVGDKKNRQTVNLQP